MCRITLRITGEQTHGKKLCLLTDYTFQERLNFFYSKRLDQFAIYKSTILR